MKLLMIDVLNISTTHTVRSKARSLNATGRRELHFRGCDHIRCHVIAGLGNLRFVPEEQPTAREDALEFGLVNLRVEEDLAADESLIELDVSLGSLHGRVSSVPGGAVLGVGAGPTATLA